MSDAKRKATAENMIIVRLTLAVLLLFAILAIEVGAAQVLNIIGTRASQRRRRRKT
ncbi:hypothetical protein [Paraburkholderia sp.]|uniref:hypothetical protein n=1 Tax=Paraburkholderia sp. TaxID=1926495 RepID=UPI003D6DE86C